MFKTNLTQILAMFAILFGITSANAQTLIWGTGHSNPTIDSIGEFASSNSTIAGTGWTSVAITTGTPWVWSADGISQGSFGSGANHIASPSLSNGVAMFDSDYFYDLGLVPQEATLTSPVIDLTGYEDSLVVIKFYAGVRDFASDSVRVRFSINGGTSWISMDVISALGHLPNGPASEGWVIFNVSSLLAGTPTLTDCRVQFYFKGDSYHFSVDDVSIETTEAYSDFAVDNVIPSIRVINNNHLPLSMVTDEETTWGANVKNTGLASLPAGQLKLHVEISKDNAGTWTLEAQDSIDIPALAPGASYFAFSSTIGTANWLPTSLGYYRVNYIVKTGVTQSDMSNDTLMDHFTITNDNYLSKVPVDPADGYPEAENATLPAVNAANELPVAHEFGSLFFIPPGLTTDTFLIKSIKYRAASASIEPGATSSIIQANIYKFTDGDGDGFWTQAYSPSDPELVLQGLGVDTFPLSSTLIYLGREIDIIDINTFSDGLVLTANSFYYVSLSQNDPLGLRNATNQTRAAYIGYMEYYYESTIDSLPDYYIPASIFRDEHVSSTGASVDNTWYTGYSNANAPVPSIGLVIEKRTVVGTTPTIAHEANVELFPNPTSNDLTVKVSLDKPTTYVQYIVTDATGRVIILHTNKNVTNDTMTFDVSPLSSGVYFLSVKTETGVTTQKFVKK